ncbi:MAG: isochorismatase family protein [bacterium]|nr:isochorismatase family protein [bacterium]
MTADELFDLLDLDSDGQLRRAELWEAARRLGWHWLQAPLYAVLDHLTILAPLPRRAFVSHLEQIQRDPHGPYGQVLRHSPLHAPGGATLRTAADAATGRDRETEDDPSAGFVPLLRRILGSEAAADYETLLREVSPPPEIRAADAAILLIDPQRSFTSGVWKRSIGPDGDHEVEPLRRVFANCGELLRTSARHLETMFTRCPFPPESYEWDERIAELVDDHQLYFVKPGNSALWPPTNGCSEWLGSLVARGKTTLVVGGCTLNSCVRVSAIEIHALMADRGLQVVVDLGLCGARTGNYVRSPMFGGRSSVESAVREMMAAGVRVVR